MFVFALLLLPLQENKIDLAQPGYSRHIYQTQEIALRYALHVPKRGKGKRPLVLALHWGWNRTQPFQPYMGEQMLRSFYQPALKNLNAVLVAPDSMGRDWGNVKVSWAVASLVKALKDHPQIDPNRIVVTGFSLGGSGTWQMLGEYPDLFSAAIPMAATPHYSATGTKVPVFSIIGEKDHTFSVARARKSLQSLKDAGTPLHSVVLPGVQHQASPDYIPALKQSITWLGKQWRASAK